MGWETRLFEDLAVGAVAGAVVGSMMSSGSGGSHHHHRTRRNVSGEIAGYLAQAQIAQDDVEKARLYGLALGLDRANTSARTGLADILEKQGRYTEAAERLAAVSYPSIELRLRTANLYARDPAQHENAFGRYSDLMKDRRLTPEHLRLVVENFFDFCARSDRANKAAELYVNNLALDQRTEPRREQFVALALRLLPQYSVNPSAHKDGVTKRGWLELLLKGANSQPGSPDLAGEIRAILERPQFQLANVLKIELKNVLDILLTVIGENEPCLCGFFEPKYAQLRGLLKQYNRSSSELVDVAEFISISSEDHASIAYLLQARVLGSNGVAAEAWQAFIEGLNNYSSGLGDSVAVTPDLARPAVRVTTALLAPQS